jgi:hypothetical protein
MKKYFQKFKQTIAKKELEKTLWRWAINNLLIKLRMTTVKILLICGIFARNEVSGKAILPC